MAKWKEGIIKWEKHCYEGDSFCFGKIKVRFFYISGRIKLINIALQQRNLRRSGMAVVMKREKFNGEKELYDEKQKYKSYDSLIVMYHYDNSLRTQKCGRYKHGFVYW